MAERDDPTAMPPFSWEDVVATPTYQGATPLERQKLTRKYVDEFGEGVVRREAAAAGLDPQLAFATIVQESRGDPNAVSPAGAMGVMQLMPATAAELGVDPQNPDQNIRGGIRYLKQQIDAFGGDVEKGLAAYNGGARRVRAAEQQGPDWLAALPAEETRNYVPSVLNRMRRPPVMEEPPQEEQDFTAPVPPHTPKPAPPFTFGDVMQTPTWQNATPQEQHKLRIAYYTDFGINPFDPRSHAVTPNPYPPLPDRGVNPLGIGGVMGAGGDALAALGVQDLSRQLRAEAPPLMAAPPQAGALMGAAPMPEPLVGPPVPPAPSRGLAADIATAFPRAVTGTLQTLGNVAQTGMELLPTQPTEMAGTMATGGAFGEQMTRGPTAEEERGRAAMQAAGKGEVEQVVQEIQRVELHHPEWFAASKEQHDSALRNALVGGTQAAAQSLMVGLPLLATGGFGGLVLGGGTLFSLAEWQQAEKDVAAYNKTAPPEKQVPPEMATQVKLLRAVAEGGGEALSNFVGGKLLGLDNFFKGAGKEALTKVLSPSLRTTLARAGGVTATETGSELGTAAVQAQAGQRAGMPGPGPLEAAKEAAGPALVASLIFAGMGLGAQRSIHRGVREALADPAADPAQRLHAAETMSQAIQTETKDAGQAQAFREAATATIQRGEALPLDLTAEQIATQEQAGQQQDLLRLLRERRPPSAAPQQQAAPDVMPPTEMLEPPAQTVAPPPVEPAPLPVAETDVPAPAPPPTAAPTAPTLTPEDIHHVATAHQIPWDDDPAFLAFSEKLTGEPHLDRMTPDQLQTLKTAIEQGERPAAGKAAPQEPRPLTTGTKSDITPGYETRQPDILQTGTPPTPGVERQTGSNEPEEIRQRRVAASTDWLEAIARNDPEAIKNATEELLRQPYKKEEQQEPDVLGRVDRAGAAVRTPGGDGETVGATTPPLGTRPPQERGRTGQPPGEPGIAPELGPQQTPRGTELAGTQGSTTGAIQTFTRTVGEALRAVRNVSDSEGAARGARDLQKLLTEAVPQSLQEEIILDAIRREADASTTITQPATVLTQPAPPTGEEIRAGDPPLATQAAPGEGEAQGQAVAPSKEAWQMTRKEWMAQRPAGTSPGMHSWEIQKALRAGQPVPPEVLADYPDLTPQTTASAQEPPATAQSFTPLSTGSQATAQTARGTVVPTQYAVVEAPALKASHNTALGVNPNYPAELQPRDRSRIASVDQVNRIANNLTPAFLGDSPKAADGAPIIGPDGAVESGNARTIALQKVYEQNLPGAQAYKQWLVENAEKFGLDAETIRQAKAPVLVRVRQGETDRVKFAQEANEKDIASMSATEQADVDAQRLDSGLLAEFAPDDSGNLLAASNRGFLRKFFETVATPDERNNYLTADGTVSQAGITRVRNAILAKAYGDPTLIARMAEDPDSNIRTVVNALTVTAPRFASIKQGIDEGNLYPLDLGPAVAQAANQLSRLREQKTSVADYLRQLPMFGGELSQEAKTVLMLFDQYARSGKKLTTVLQRYAEIVEIAGSPQQQTMFGGETPNLETTLQAAIDVLDTEEQHAPDLFAPQQKTPGRPQEALLPEASPTAGDTPAARQEKEQISTAAPGPARTPSDVGPAVAPAPEPAAETVAPPVEERLRKVASAVEAKKQTLSSKDRAAMREALGGMDANIGGTPVRGLGDRALAKAYLGTQETPPPPGAAPTDMPPLEPPGTPVEMPAGPTPAPPIAVPPPAPPPRAGRVLTPEEEPPPGAMSPLEMPPAPVPAPAADPVTPETLRQDLQTAFNATPEQADAAVALVEARANAWAKETGSPKEEWYRTHLAGVKKGGTPGAGALFQEASSWYFSSLRRAFETAQQEKMDPLQALAVLKAPGVKAEEVKWTGVDTWLKEQTKPVSKQEVLNFLDQQQVEVREVVKGETPETTQMRQRLDELGPLGRDRTHEQEYEYNRLGARLRKMQEASQATKFSSYTLPGAQEGSYRELLLTLPPNAPERMSFEEYWKRVGLERQVGNVEAAPADIVAKARKDYETYGNTPRDEQGFRSSHWDEPNVFAHIRFNDRTGPHGKKILFVEEVQSDWSTEGRKKGFKGDFEKSLTAEERELRDLNAMTWDGREQTAAQQQRAKELQTKVGVSLQEKANRGRAGVPSMPFAKNWHEVALKRVLHWASSQRLPGNEAWIEVTKPESMREQFENYLGSEMAAVTPFKVVNAAMLPGLKNDQIRQAVIKAIPVNVVNVLSKNGVSSEDFLSKPDVVGQALSIDDRTTVAGGLTRALELVGTRLRTALNRVLLTQPSGRDEELFSTIRASDLNPHVVAGLLAPHRIYVGDELGRDMPDSGSRRTFFRTEPPATVSSKEELAGPGRELSVTELADALNRHDTIITGRPANSIVKKYVAPSEYQALAWVTGEHTADRYDLSKQISEVQYYPENNHLYAYGREGTEVINETNVAPEQLPDYIGKEPAEKLLQAPLQKDIGRKFEYRSLSGLDLKVGGAWARNLYDKTIPQYLAKYGKKWGVQVGTTQIDVQGSPETGTGLLQEQEYQGPLRTLEDVRAARRTAPNVLVERQVRAVATLMDNGIPFREAMRSEASSAAARHLGGDMVPVAQKLQTVHAIPITEAMKQSVTTEGQPLFQGPQHAPQGSTEFLEDGRALLRGLQAPNFSTAVHEIAHVFRRDLSGADLATVEDWARVQDGQWNRANEEGFARGFERYLREGQAPTPELQTIFQRMKEWLTDIYRALVGSPINIEITPAVRQVFDRLLGAASAPVEDMPPLDPPPVTGTLPGTGARAARALGDLTAAAASRKRGERGAVATDLLSAPMRAIGQAARRIGGTAEIELEALLGEGQGSAAFRDRQWTQMRIATQEAQVIETMGELLTHDKVWKVLARIFGPGPTAEISRFFRSSRWVGSMFGVAAARQDLLFDAAEGIKTFHGATPEFGTRIFEKDPDTKELIRDPNGDPMMKEWRYTPADAQANWDALTTQEQAAVKYWVDMRDIIKEAFNVSGEIEGYVHHFWDKGFFEGLGAMMGRNIRLRKKTAPGRKARGAEEGQGYVRDFERAVIKSWSDLIKEDEWNQMVKRLVPLVTRPIGPEGILPGWQKIEKTMPTRRAAFVGQLGGGRQIPTQLYNEMIAHGEVVKDQTAFAQTARTIGSYLSANLLMHVGTFVNNMAGSGMQYATFVADTGVKMMLTGQGRPFVQTLAAPFQALLPSVRAVYTPELLGSHSNLISQFENHNAMEAAFSTILGGTMGAVDNYVKRTVALAVGKSLGLPLDQAAISANKKAYAEMRQMVDTFGLDYDNINSRLATFRKGPYSRWISPFVTYGYKIMQMMGHYLAAVNPGAKMDPDPRFQFDQTLLAKAGMQPEHLERLSRLIVLGTIYSLLASLFPEDEEKTGPRLPGMPMAVDRTGMLKLGDRPGGKERWVNLGGHPWIGPFLSARALSRWYQSGASPLGELEAALGAYAPSGGPVIQGYQAARDYSKDPQRYPLGPSVARAVKPLMPFGRMAEGVRRMEGGPELQSRTFAQELAEASLVPIPDEWMGARKIIRDQRTGAPILRDPTLEQWKFWAGVRLKDIRPAEYRGLTYAMMENAMEALEEAETPSDVERAVERIKQVNPTIGKRIEKAQEGRVLRLEQRDWRVIERAKQRQQQELPASGGRPTAPPDMPLVEPPTGTSAFTVPPARGIFGAGKGAE